MLFLSQLSDVLPCMDFLALFRQYSFASESSTARKREKRRFIAGCTGRPECPNQRPSRYHRLSIFPGCSIRLALSEGITFMSLTACGWREALCHVSKRRHYEKFQKLDQ